MGNFGAKVLETVDQVRRRGIRWDTNNRHLSRVFLHHTLTVGEVMVAFEVACRGREGVRLIPPEDILAAAPESTRRQRLPFLWQVEVRQSEKPHRLGVIPDQVFGLHFENEPEGRNRAYFFLEAARGTMPVARKGLGQTSFSRKLLAYQETWRQDLHKTHHGIPTFRVLTATTNRERVEHLIEACRSLSGTGSRLFLFTDRERFGGGEVLMHEWVNGRGKAVGLAAENRSTPQAVRVPDLITQPI